MTDAISAPDPSTLGVAVELVHLPIQISTDHLRDVYVEVSGPCGYENFTRQGNGACLETVADAENGASRVTIGRDRLIFQEEGAAEGVDVGWLEDYTGRPWGISWGRGGGPRDILSMCFDRL